MGVLAVSDIEAVARYAICLELSHRAAEQLKDVVEPVIPVLDPKTGELRFTRNCPELDLFLQMAEQLKRMDAVLGLTPVDRAKLGIARSDTKPAGGDAFGDLIRDVS